MQQQGITFSPSAFSFLLCAQNKNSKRDAGKKKKYTTLNSGSLFYDCFLNIPT
jgi:hypothetical protein